MKVSRRKFLDLAAGAAALPFLSQIARAQAYPMRPVKCIVAYAPGGPSDIFVRLVGQSLSERLGQPIVIENRAGACATASVAILPLAPSRFSTTNGWPSCCDSQPPIRRDTRSGVPPAP